MAKCCGNGTRLVYACSGGADVGEIADRVARRLVKKRFARPSCLAGVGEHVSGFVASARGEAQNITIDGCALACAPHFDDPGDDHFRINAVSHQLG